MDDENSLIAERRAKLAAVRTRGIAFPNDFKPKDRAAELARNTAISTTRPSSPCTSPSPSPAA